MPRPRASASAIIAGVLYIGLAAGFFLPALRSGKTLSGSDLLWIAAPWATASPAGWRQRSNIELFDAATQYEPWRQYTTDYLPRIPLWNPYIMGGRPFLANSQSAVFSLFSVPSYVLPFGLANTVTAIFKLSVAAMGTFVLCGVLGVSRSGAFLAGIIYAFGLFQVTNVSWPFTSVWVLIPWLMVCADACIRRPSPRSVAVLAAAIGLQFFSGHPESSFHALVTMGLFFVLRLIHVHRSDRVSLAALSRSIGAFSLACVAGAALAAIVLIPFLELVLHSSDLTERAGGVMPRIMSVMLFMPDWWGRPTGVHFGDGGLFFCRAFYTGALPLMFAVTAIVFRPSLQRVGAALFAIWAIGSALGFPVINPLTRELPMFSTANNGRLMILFLLAVSLLTGRALDDLAYGNISRTRATLILIGAAALLCLPLVWIRELHFPAVDLPLAFKTAWSLIPYAGGAAAQVADTTRFASAIRWFAVAGAAWLLLLARLAFGWRSRWFVVLAIAITAADLFHVGVGYNPAIDASLLDPPATNAIKYLQTRRPRRFVGLGPALLFSSVLTPNSSMRYGLFDARGYDFPVERRYDRLWRKMINPDWFYSSRQLTQLDARALRGLSLLGVSEIIVPHGLPPGAPLDLRLAYQGYDADVYTNTQALPRAFVAHTQHVARDEEDAWGVVTNPEFDARQVVVTERPLPEIASEPSTKPGDALIVDYQPERVVIRATTDRPGVVVLTDVAYPGWTATVDGQGVDVERVDYLLRGIPIGPGEHAVELRYNPLSYTIGAYITAIVFIGILLAFLFLRSSYGGE